MFVKVRLIHSRNQSNPLHFLIIKPSFKPYRLPIYRRPYVVRYCLPRVLLFNPFSSPCLLFILYLVNKKRSNKNNPTTMKNASPSANEKGLSLIAAHRRYLFVIYTKQDTHSIRRKWKGFGSVLHNSFKGNFGYCIRFKRTAGEGN